MERVLIAGIGNIFLGDDAFGIEVVRILSGRELPNFVRVVDFGIRGFDLAYALMDGYEISILVDATPRGGVPGTIYTIEPDLRAPEPPPAPTSPEMDGHSMNPVNVLNLVRVLGGELKRVLVVGCEPETLGTEEEGQGRMGLSEPVQRAVTKAVDVILDLIASLSTPQRAAANVFDPGAAVAYRRIQWNA